MLPLIALVPLLTLGTSHQDSTVPDIPREFRAAWVATVANIDWPSQPGLSPDDQRSEMLRLLDTAVSMKLNAIIFQIRPSCDAMYNSKLEPWSEYLNGLQGRAPSPFYDPLEFVVTQAHARGLEVHCWFNPYRASLSAQKASFASSHLKYSHPDIVKQYGKFLWLDPGESYVQKHSLDVIRDVVHRYDIDGVHIDDYFYPYPEKGQEFPDDPSYHRYVSKGGKLDRSDWRRQNVDTFVHGMYEAIKKEKPWVKVGISPFGIYRPGIPDGIKAGVDQYADLYADCKKWLNEGWCDYFSPQLYWPIAQKPQSYPVLLDWWIEQNTRGRHIWPGLYTSRVGSDEGKTWQLQEVLDQISMTRGRPGSTGEVHFSMKVFLKNSQNISSTLSEGLYAHRALVPASPWLSDSTPAAPKVVARKGDDGKLSLDIKPGDKQFVRFYSIRVKVGRWLEPRVTDSRSVTLTIDPTISPDEISVTAIDRVGNQSQPTSVDLSTKVINR